MTATSWPWLYFFPSNEYSVPVTLTDPSGAGAARQLMRLFARNPSVLRPFLRAGAVFACLLRKATPLIVVLVVTYSLTYRSIPHILFGVYITLRHVASFLFRPPPSVCR